MRPRFRHSALPWAILVGLAFAQPASATLTIPLDQDGKFVIPTVLRSIDLAGTGLLPLGEGPGNTLQDMQVDVRTLLLGSSISGVREIFPFGGTPNGTFLVTSGQPALVVETYFNLPIGVQIEDADPTASFASKIPPIITFTDIVPDFGWSQVVTLDLSVANLGTQLRTERRCSVKPSAPWPATSTTTVPSTQRTTWC